MTTPREVIAAALTEGLPAKGYIVIPDERSLDALTKTTVIVSQQGFAPFTQSPLSHITLRFTVRVVSPVTDLAKAEATLNDSVTDVCRLISALPNADWQDARKVVHADRYLAYDIDLTTTATF